MVHSLQGMLGWDDQSQMISEAESPFSSAATLTSGLFKWFMYTALSSSSKDEANSGFGVFGGDLGDPPGVFFIDMNADEMGETLFDDQLDSL